ncbi:hypothetical protein CKM354_000195300 [Cercospora kikuchii]|uniref:Uncharacterized protein n=1 Tax=Cercospora kikuchii TaxID=84275 RepID=A0A9P3FCB8_9PEZI|nr:uncharacterized protein CKM354_000195300 [Cercospora kikuchii]GIZ38537.1 hypothetical protein CKM354_000195300 [Cercospora kikuchii]
MVSTNMPKGPFKLVTVNTAPERAKRLVGRVAQNLQETYEIQHLHNCERIDEVQAAVRENQPDLLFCASMWSAEEAEQILSIAREVNPNIITYAIPHGLQVEQGPDAIVEHLTQKLPPILEASYGQNS